ncbi:hypothetical protein [Kordia jejudonensis]|uniref:hypothetical protein n=1 Tax=Kordia jejudonensis TaxID=1348245 RepID=UPI000629AA6A|nr:hypothetical protein [Kordia jejudonensis]
MRKIACTLLFCFCTVIVNSQTASVEKSVFGIQTGFLGIWAHNESRLSSEIALRTELGLDTGFFGSALYDVSGFLLAPTITLEPRWYYNLEKRQSKSRRIDGNSGNFLALKITYHPDWFVISNEPNINFISDLSIVPTWGIRRHIGKHFTYETGIGIGYIHYFDDDIITIAENADVTVNLHLRIGYRF